MEQVLVVNRQALEAKLGGQVWVTDHLDDLRQFILDHHTFLPRQQAEYDATVRQIIPYGILRRGGELLPQVLAFGDIRLNQSTFCLEREGKSIRLGKREYEVLQILMHHKGAVVSKETLLLKIWGNDGEAVDNNVEIYISFLRKKLDFLGAKTAILTARHLGYYLSEGGRL